LLHPSFPKLLLLLSFSFPFSLLFFLLCYHISFAPPLWVSGCDLFVPAESDTWVTDRSTIHLIWEAKEAFPARKEEFAK